MTERSEMYDKHLVEMLYHFSAYQTFMSCKLCLFFSYTFYVDPPDLSREQNEWLNMRCDEQAARIV